MSERDSKAKMPKSEGRGMYHIGSIGEDITPTRQIRTPGEVVIEALRRAGAIKDWDSLSPEQLTLVQETNQAADFLNELAEEDKES